MRKLTPLILLVALAAAGFLAWRQGWFVGAGADGGDGGPAVDAPSGPAGATDLAAGGRRAADPEKDPASYEGDTVGRVDLGRGPARLKGRVVDADGPLRFARVSPVLPPPATASVRTRKDGTFEVTGLPVGDVDLRVGAADHVSRTVTVPGLADGVEKDLGDVVLVRRPPMTDGLSVKVIDEAGRPIAGAKVKASTLPWGLLVTMGARAGMPDVISHEATTDELGFARIVPMAPERYDVVARAPEHTLDGVGNVVVAAGRVERVTITLKRALTIEGIVVDAEKVPVAGAYVSCLGMPTFRSYELVETDASGRFTLTGLAAGTYMILGGRDDRGEGMTPNVKAGDRAARIQLGGAGAIKGRVLEADGKPAVKFSVRPYTGDWFRYNYSRQFAFEDPEGRFVLPMAPGAYSLDVRSESGSFTTSKAVTVVKGENAETEIKLPPAGVVTGVVTDPDGAHLSGAEVFVKRGGFPPEPVREQYARADADGRFTVKGLAIEQVKLHVRHAGFATTEFATTAAPADQAKEVTIRMGRGARVLGTVRTKDGRPVEGAQLNLAQGFDFFSAKTAFTDATGAFVFTAVAAGKYQVSMGRFENGASGQRKEANVPAEGDVVLEFQAQDDPTGTGSVTGKVTVAGKPVAKAVVNALDDRGGDAGASTETAADGTFTLAGLRPGRVQVWVQTPDGMTDSETVTVSDGGGAAAVKFDFGSASIRATLVGADGKTVVTGAWVIVEKAEKREGGSDWEGVKAQVNSDEHGVVVATGLDPATYRLRIVGSGHAAKVTDPFPVADGESRDLGTVRLAAGGGVTGKVTGSAGEPLEGIGVSVRNARGESVFLFNIASTGSNGRYELQGIEFGTYRLKFEGKGFAPVEQDVTVTGEGAVADAVMVSGGALVARVEDERGQPVADARIVLYDGTGKRLERTLSIVNLFDADATRTKASGTATIPDLAPGRYRATVEKDGAVAVGDPVAFSVEAGGRAEVTLVLKQGP